AERALKVGGSTTEDRLDYLTGRLLARPFRPEERKVAEVSLADLTAYYQAHPADAKALTAVGESKGDTKLDPPTLAAWTMLTNELYNRGEVRNRGRAPPARRPPRRAGPPNPSEGNAHEPLRQIRPERAPPTLLPPGLARRRLGRAGVAARERPV